MRGLGFREFRVSLGFREFRVSGKRPLAMNRQDPSSSAMRRSCATRATFG